MQTIKNKLIITKVFSMLLLLVFFVGLQNPVLAEDFSGKTGQPANKTGAPCDTGLIVGQNGFCFDAHLGASIHVRYPTIPMVPGAAIWDEWKDVTRNLKDKQIIIANGKLSLKNGQPFTSEGIETLFVMDTWGNIYVHNVMAVDASYSHSTFFSGSDVASAGTITVVGGVITNINNNSGHYQPKNIDNVLRQLQVMGVDSTKLPKQNWQDWREPSGYRLETLGEAGRWPLK